jgi:hypothetical protein
MLRQKREKSGTGICHMNGEPARVHTDIVKDIFEKGTDSDLHMGISPSPNDNFSNIKENKEGLQKEINDKIYDEKKK